MFVSTSSSNPLAAVLGSRYRDALFGPAFFSGVRLGGVVMLVALLLVSATSQAQLIILSSVRGVPSGGGTASDCSLSSITYVPTGVKYPDESCTGWEHTGVTLTTYSSPCTITNPGTVIDSKDILCDNLIIRANNVTIKRSRMSASGGGNLICNNCDEGMVVTGLLVEDVEVNCNSAPGSAGVGAENYTARRVNVYECENNFWCNFTCTIVDSYSHDTMYHGTPGCPIEGGSPTCHTDAMQVSAFGGFDVTVTHNVIYGRYVGGGDFGSGALSSAEGVNLLYEDNIIAGAGYSFRFDEDFSGTNTNVQLINNKLSKVFVSTYGGFGPCNGNFNGSGVTSSGNVDFDTGATIASCN